MSPEISGPESPAFEGTLRRRSRRLTAVLGALLSVGAVLAGLFYMGIHFAAWRMLVFAIFVAGGGIGLASKLINEKKKSRDARVAIDARGIWIDGALALVRADVAVGAHLRPLAHGELSVRIPAKKPFSSLDLGVKDEAEGMAILHALGQDPAHAKIRFRLASGFENKTLRQVATAVIALSSSCGGVINGKGEAFEIIFIVWALGFSVAALSFLLPTYVTVGADGVLVEKRGRKRFVPFSSIAEVQFHPDYPDAIVLALEEREKITLRTSIQDRRNASLAVSDDTRALRSRIETALQAFRAQTVHADALLQLKRGGRSAKEWIESLENLRKERGYREIRVSDEALWSVLEDPSASAEDRAAALVALRVSLDDQGKTRQRVALEACAEPRLRVVYEAAAKEDEAELESALDELHETA